MNAQVCEKCGSSDFVVHDGMRVCMYCRAKYELTKNETIVNSEINLDEDVQRLLQKCIDDPRNARRYANLILDIDPENHRALSILGL